MCTKGSTKVTTRSYPFCSLRIGRENNTLPIPFDHSLYLKKMFNSSYPEGNKLPPHTQV